MVISSPFIRGHEDVGFMYDARTLFEHAISLSHILSLTLTFTFFFSYFTLVFEWACVYMALSERKLL